MSKSLKRVLAEAEKLNFDIAPIKLDSGTTTAQMAADAVNCKVDQIIKSIIFKRMGEDEHFLFLTAGSNRVDLAKAETVSDTSLEKADAASIRKHTGFAIGGVSPLGHLNPIRTFMDPHILTFDLIWAAAGTPHHVFKCNPEILREKVSAEIADFTV